jgi:HemY protein
MISLLLLLFFLTCVGMCASWFAENPGNVVIHWFGYRIDTSFAFLMVMALVAAFVLAYSIILCRHLALVPERITRRRSLRHYQKGLTELTCSVAALAAADSRKAQTHLRNVEKLLGNAPITLLLGAQIARSQGDEMKTRQLLSRMLDHKETEFLAARSLCETANKQHLFPKALELAKRANNLSSRDLAPLLSLHIRLGQWQEATHAIEKSTRKAHLTRGEIRHYQLLVLLTQSRQMLAHRHNEAALTAAKKALRQDAGFTPAIAQAALCYNACGKRAAGLKLLAQSWKAGAGETLAEVFCSIVAAEPKDQQLKWARKLMAAHPASAESDLLVAQVAMKQRDFKTARAGLTEALKKSETVRTCKLFAALEEAEYPGLELSSKWIARAAGALPDAQWLCNGCGKASLAWDAHCPSCEAFDSLEWKKRDMLFSG